MPLAAWNRKDATARLSAWLWQGPAGRQPRHLGHLRALLRTIIIFFREFDQDRIPLRASALTFTIILSLVPVLALGTAVLKGLGAGDQMRLAAHRMIAQMESSAAILDSYHLDRGEPSPTTPTPAVIEEASGSAHLHRAVDQIFDYVERTDFATIGTFGIVGLVIAVVSVLGGIEKSMNAIWNAPDTRPLGRRFLDYLALIILLPLAINLALATEATLQSETLFARLQTFLPLGTLAQLLLNLMPLALLVGTFTILYRFLPNTKVKLTSALVGGLFGGILWLLTQALYLKLQIGVARYNAIYGSFATFPLFLIWLQLCWIIFLSGAEMAFVVQFQAKYRPDGDRQRLPLTRLALAFAIIDIVHRNFKARRLTELAALSEELSEPESVVEPVARLLTEADILRPAADIENCYLLGTTLEKLNPAEILDLVLGTEVPPVRGSSLAIEAMEAARQAVRHKNLATMN